MSNSKISALTAATTPLIGASVLPIVQSGVTKQVSVANLTVGRAVDTAGGTFTDNQIQGTASKGINFTANTSAAGMVSRLLNWYEEGTWTPTQGAGLTVVGAFSSAGTYTRVGRQVTVSGFVVGATSIAASSFGAVCGGIPFTPLSGSVTSNGSCWTTAPAASTLYISSTTGNVISPVALAASTIINFTLTYFV